MSITPAADPTPMPAAAPALMLLEELGSEVTEGDGVALESAGSVAVYRVRIHMLANKTSTQGLGSHCIPDWYG